MKPLQLTKSMQSAKLNWRQILFAGLLIGSLFCSPVVTLFAGSLFALTLGNPFPVWSKKASKKLLQYCEVLPLLRLPERRRLLAAALAEKCG